jgi:hypothetical protein
MTSPTPEYDTPLRVDSLVRPHAKYFRLIQPGQVGQFSFVIVSFRYPAHILQDLTLLHPHFFATSIAEEQIIALIGAQWREFMLEQQLSGQELCILRNLPEGTMVPRSENAPVQVELVKQRLERAKLEVQLYNLVLNMFPPSVA